MQRILGGIDRSAESRRALDWAAGVASRAGVELCAALVQPRADGGGPDDGQAELELLVSGTAVPVHARLLEGDPADALLAAAASEEAGLLVVGSRGAGGFAGLQLGSVANHLARITTLPLVVIPPTAADHVDHVVVGVDGSSGSLGAVAFATDVAAALGIGATAVYAFEPFVEWVPSNDPGSWQRHAREQVQEWVAPLEQAGVTVAIEVDRDVHPVASIGRAIDAHPAALAVVGTRGRGGFAGLRLGRVPSQLVHHTGAAVALVPTPLG